MKKTAMELFESVEHNVVVTKIEENVFLAERMIKRDNITLIMNEKVNEEGAAIALEMGVRQAIAPFIIVRANENLRQYMDEQDKAEEVIFNSMFTEEELETLTEFYTTHENYESAMKQLEEEVLPKYKKAEDK